MKVISLSYQRNGISGEGFYQIVFKNLVDEKGTYLATFDTLEDDVSINWRTCRVSNLNDFSLAYRGDRIAIDIQTHLNNEYTLSVGQNMYDRIKMINQKAHV